MSSHDSDVEDLIERACALLADREGPDDLASANELVSRVLRIRPGDAEAWLLKCQILSAQGDHTAALAAAEMALRRAPGSPEVYYWRAVVLCDLDRHSDALRSIDRAFRSLTTDDEWLLEDVICEKANILEAAGRTSDALRTCEAGLDRFPESVALRTTAEPLRRSTVRARFKVLQGGLR